MSTSDRLTHSIDSDTIRPREKHSLISHALPNLLFPFATLSTGYYVKTQYDSADAAFDYIKSLLLDFATVPVSMVVAYSAMRLFFRNGLSVSKWSPIFGGIAAFLLFGTIYTPLEPLLNALIDFASPPQWKGGLIAMGIVLAATGIAAEYGAFRATKTIKSYFRTQSPNPA